MEFEWAVKFIWEIENIKWKFDKRSIVLVDGRYSNKGIIIDFIWKKIELTKNLEKWYIVKVVFNTKCYESKDHKWMFFNSFYGTSCEIIDKFTACSNENNTCKSYFDDDWYNDDEKGERYYDIDLWIYSYVETLDNDEFNEKYRNKNFEDPHRFRKI